MTNTQMTFQDVEVAEIVSGAVGDRVSENAAAATDLAAATRTQKILIDGVEYDATNLTAAAQGAIASLQFAEAKMMALQNELAICHTAQFAYVNSLKAELESKES